MEKKTSFEKLMELVNKIGHAILLNLLFLVSCIPVFTIGAAVSGLYGAVRYSIRQESAYAGYKEGFCSHFLRNSIATVLCLAVGLYSFNHLFVNIGGMIADPALIRISTVLPTLLHLAFFLAVVLFGTAMIPVGLYFESNLNDWISDAWTLVRYSFFPLLAVAAIFWAPIALILWMPQWGLLVLMVFVAVYYAVMAVVATALLKKPLIRMLEEKREES